MELASMCCAFSENLGLGLDRYTHADTIGTASE